jgi:hypothetical protein
VGDGIQAFPPAGVAMAGARAAPAGAMITGEGRRAGLAPTTQAARPCGRRRWRQQQRLKAVAAAVMVDVGRLQDMLMTCTPAAWLNTTRALNPLARQRSYSAEKSVVETAGSGLERGGSPTLALAPPLTTVALLAVGETREVGGRGEGVNSWHTAGLACSPMTPEEGEAG